MRISLKVAPYQLLKPLFFILLIMVEGHLLERWLISMFIGWGIAFPFNWPLIRAEPLLPALK